MGTNDNIMKSNHKYLYLDRYMEKFYVQKETKEGSQMSDKHAVRPFEIFDVIT